MRYAFLSSWLSDFKTIYWLPFKVGQTGIGRLKRGRFKKQTVENLDPISNIGASCSQELQGLKKSH